MDRPMQRQNLGFDHSAKVYRFRPGRRSERDADTIGYWFAAAVFCAFLAAGAIVYQTGTSEIRTAANDMPLAAQSSPLDPAPILPR